MGSAPDVETDSSDERHQYKPLAAHGNRQKRVRLPGNASIDDGVRTCFIRLVARAVSPSKSNAPTSRGKAHCVTVTLCSRARERKCVDDDSYDPVWKAHCETITRSCEKSCVENHRGDNDVQERDARVENHSCVRSRYSRASLPSQTVANWRTGRRAHCGRHQLFCPGLPPTRCAGSVSGDRFNFAQKGVIQ